MDTFQEKINEANYSFCAADYTKALALYQEALLLEKSEVAYIGMGWCFHAKNDLISAVECFQNAIELEPNSGQAYLNLSYMYSEMGWVNEEKRYLEFVITRTNNENAIAVAQARLLASEGKFTLALDVLQRQNSIPSQNQDSLLLGYVLMRLKRYAEAIACLLDAADIEPRSPYIHYLIGVTKYKQGDYTGSAIYLKKAISLNETFYAPYLYLAHVELRYFRFKNVYRIIMDATTKTDRNRDRNVYYPLEDGS